VVLVALALVSAPAHAAGLLVADGGFGGVLEIQEHTVEVTFNNGIVVTTVNQVFLNTEQRQVGALRWSRRSGPGRSTTATSSAGAIPDSSSRPTTGPSR
jgi:hypothetical protein